MGGDHHHTLSFGQGTIDPLPALRADHPPDLLGRKGIHQHEVGEHLEVVAESVPRRALHQRVVPGQAQHLAEVLEGDPAAPGHQVEGAPPGDGRQRVANSRRERPHHQVPQPEQPRQQHQRRAVACGAGTAWVGSAASASTGVPAMKASVSWCATPSVTCLGGDFMK